MAILLAVGGAFAAKFNTPCEFEIQYYWNGGTYVEAGQEGVNYFCFQQATVCTYYRPNPIGEPWTYVPCKYGEFFPIQ